MNLNNFTCCYHATFKIIAPTTGFGHFSFCIDFMVDHHDPSPSLVATSFYYFCNAFMDALLSVYLLHLQNPQRNFMNMMCSKALTFQIFCCA